MRHVLIADDHPLIRRGLRELLREAFGAIDVVEVADGGSVLTQLPCRPWDLILLDIGMPGPSMVSLIAQIRIAIEGVPILVLTAMTEVEYIVQAMKAGANGLVHKHRADDELAEAIRGVAAGGLYLHPESAIAVATEMRETTPSLGHLKLSERELEIFCAIARGRAVKEIAGDLSLSEKTVATYIGRIREKTDLRTSVAITRYALRHRLVD